MIKRGMAPMHPGLVLKEMYLEPLGISVTDFADNIGVARRTASLIVNEHSGISAEMALRLSKAFNTTPELWLNMQQKYDLWNAGQKLSLKAIKHFTTRTRSTTQTVRAASAVTKGSPVEVRKAPSTKRPTTKEISKH